MREKLQRFMTGRYGADELGRILNIVVLVSLVVSMFSGLLPVLSVFYWFGIALMIYNCFRMFSKNVSMVWSISSLNSLAVWRLKIWLL